MNRPAYARLTKLSAKLENKIERAWQLAEELEGSMSDVLGDMLCELLEGLTPVLELAASVDPSLVHYHLRKLGVDPLSKLWTLLGERRAA
jgi:hypothetical protein